MSAHEICSPEDDEAAFASVYRAHSEKLLRYCQYRLRDRHEAEDVVQEAFARAWRTRPATGPDQDFYPWLRVVAANLCTDILRRRSRSEPVAVIDLGSVDGDLDRITEEADRVLVRRALGRLNDRHRSALMMRESEGLTYDQIAQRTGVTPGTVESLLWRARQALRREFTVLAGREGSLALAPFLLCLARARSSWRRGWLRLARRSAAVDPSTDTTLSHAAVAAMAALTLASGVALTFGVSQHHGGAPSVVVQGRLQPASTTAPAPSVSPPVTTAAVVPAPPAAPAAAVAPTPPPTWRPAPMNGSKSSPLRVVSPVIAGRSAAGYATASPLAVQAGGWTLGASPPSVTRYAQHVTQRAVDPAVSTVNTALEEKTP